MTAVFWIASGEKYIEEARVSALSMQRQMPDIERVLFTPNPVESINAKGFSVIYKVPDRTSDYWLLDNTRYMLIALPTLQDWGHQYAFNLDTDTYVCAPFYDLIVLLEHGVELVGVHAPGRRTTKTVYDIPDCFPEINIGMIGFRLSERLINFVTRWMLIYVARQDVYGNNDQGPLRDALWENIKEPDPIQFYVTTQEYNVRPFGAFIKDEARVLHGRNIDFERWATEINRNKGTMRTWTPMT